jgi:hypothetical protein
MLGRCCWENVVLEIHVPWHHRNAAVDLESDSYCSYWSDVDGFDSQFAGNLAVPRFRFGLSSRLDGVFLKDLIQFLGLERLR